MTQWPGHCLLSPFYAHHDSLFMLLQSHWHQTPRLLSWVGKVFLVMMHCTSSAIAARQFGKSTCFQHTCAGAFAEAVAAQLTDEELDDLETAANSVHFTTLLRAYTSPAPQVLLQGTVSDQPCSPAVLLSFQRTRTQHIPRWLSGSLSHWHDVIIRLHNEPL